MNVVNIMSAHDLYNLLKPYIPAGIGEIFKAAVHMDTRRTKLVLDTSEGLTTIDLSEARYKLVQEIAKTVDIPILESTMVILAASADDNKVTCTCELYPRMKQS